MRCRFTTQRDQRQRPAPDLVNRHFVADAPNVLWVADITYIPTWAGFIFLAVVLDVWSRRVVGWSIGETLETSLMLLALVQRLQTQRPKVRQMVRQVHRPPRHAHLRFGLCGLYAHNCPMSRRHPRRTSPTQPEPESSPSGVCGDRLAEVRALAADVLGSADAADEWLHVEALGLEFRKPIDLLDEPGGVEAVMTLLQRMTYGVYS